MPLELRRILLANTYLILYNLVESTIRDVIEEIYYHFDCHGVTFDSLKDDIKKTILTDFKAINNNRIIQRIDNLTTDIISTSFQSEKISKGNIDARKIREIAKKYCFSSSTSFESCTNGDKLLEIKNKRNNLAHGIISFSECGREVTIGDLEIAFSESSSYLEKIVENVKAYLIAKDYLRSEV